MPSVLMTRIVSAEAGQGDGPFVKGISWTKWRGPDATGASPEINLPNEIDPAKNLRWTFDIRGRGTPVYANGRVFGMGYAGSGPDLQEILYCLDESTGDLLWEHRFSDFLSDIIYERYSITSPTIDDETGNVYCMTVPGLLNCFSFDGELIWQVSTMEMYGRFTYPNGRTLGPLIDDDLLIIDFMNSTWGRNEGPARNRFFAFDKLTGENVWMSNPSGPPKDGPSSYPVFEWRNGERLLYAGEAGGLLVCVNTRTGEPVWSYRMTVGGVCASPVLSGNRLIAIHDTENVDSSEIGRMVAFDLSKTPTAPGDPGDGTSGQIEVDPSYELWRNNLGAFTSSPVLVGDRVYQTTGTGELACVDVNSGKVIWKEKLAPDQIHASPAYADSKLYVPMNNGSFHVIRPTDEGPEVLSKVQLEGNCLGAPCIANGKVYVHTTEKLYCFGNDSGMIGPVVQAGPRETAPKPGAAVALQAIPAEVLLQAGESVPLRARSVDAHGLVVEENVSDLSLGENAMGVSYSGGRLRVSESATPQAAVVPVTANGLTDSVRIRIVDSIPFSYDFENVNLDQKDAAGEALALGPAYWIQARPRWDVRQMADGNRVLAKTIENPIFMRAMTFIGDPDQRDYTMQADMMTDGNRRMMSTVGLVHQRYLILLKCNHRELEIQSNEEGVKHAVTYSFKPEAWYTVKSRVDVDAEGIATIRAKVWERDKEQEPDAWTIEYTHTNGHVQGAPGIYGFALQNRFKVYIDNLSVTPN